MDDFTCIAAHDLKEPLLGLSSYCDLLLEDYGDKLDQEGRRRLEAMIGLCDRLNTLIDTLLTYCRLGQIRPADTEVDLNAVAEEVLRVFEPAIDRRGASVRVLGRLPVARGDATLVSMVLSNLISNGLKFNDGAEPSVQIGSVASDPPAIFVRDNGIGIAKEHHEAIFTIFRRLHGRKKYEGSGAGLTIVRKIVELHGGMIWLESEPGRGATFFFTLAPTKTKLPGQPPHWLTRSSAAAASTRPAKH